MDLAPEDLDFLYARLVRKGMGARTINRVHATARVALFRATKKRLVRANPARDVDPSRYSTDTCEYDVLSYEEVGRFVGAFGGDRFEAFFVPACSPGRGRPCSGRSPGPTWARTQSPSAGPCPRPRGGAEGPQRRECRQDPRRAAPDGGVLRTLGAQGSSEDERLADGPYWHNHQGLVFPDLVRGLLRGRFWDRDVEASRALCQDRLVRGRLGSLPEPRPMEVEFLHGVSAAFEVR